MDANYKLKIKNKTVVFVNKKKKHFMCFMLVCTPWVCNI